MTIINPFFLLHQHYEQLMTPNNDKRHLLKGSLKTVIHYIIHAS